MDVMIMDKDLQDFHKKLDKIVESTTDTRIKVSVIEEHLKNLNSKVACNVEAIEKNRVCIDERFDRSQEELYNIKLKLVAIATIGATIASSVIGFAINFFKGGF